MPRISQSFVTPLNFYGNSPIMRKCHGWLRTSASHTVYLEAAFQQSAQNHPRARKRGRQGCAGTRRTTFVAQVTPQQDESVLDEVLLYPGALTR